MAKKKPGRPKGSKTKEIKETSVRVVHTCTRCGSDNRAPYKLGPRVTSGYWEREGKIYTRAEARQTQCLECGLFRFDVTLFEK